VARARVRVVGALAAVAAVVGACAIVVPGAAQADQTSPVQTPYVHEYPTTGTGTDPTITAMATGSNGRPWFVTADGRTGYVDASGKQQYFTVNAGDDLEGLVAASDGSLWTFDSDTQSAFRIASDGTSKSVAIGIDAASVVAGSGGSVWFYDADSPTLVKVTSALATSTVAAVSLGGVTPTQGGYGDQSAVVDGSGNVWFVPADAALIERVDTSGNVTAYKLSGPGNTLTVDGSGNVWVGLQAGGVVKVTSSGNATTYGANRGSVLSAVTGSDGRTWIAEDNGNAGSDIAAVDSSGNFTKYTIPNSTTTLPYELTSAPDGSIWFDQYAITGTAPDSATRITTSGTTTSLPLTSPVYAITATSDTVWFGESNGTVAATASAAVDRISGSARYETSVALAEAAYGGTTGGSVYIATGTNYPDALAAGPAAAKRDAPLLLTAPGSLPTAISDELTKLAPSHVYVVGGTAAVSASTYAQIESTVHAADADATIERVAGADRFDTARQLDADAFGTNVTTAYVATGTNYPDALAAAAAAGSQSVPVVLVNGSATSIDSATTTFLSSLGVQDVTIVGGTSAVSTGIANGLTAARFSVSRIAGVDRFDTAAQIAAAAFPSGTSHVYLATGTAFPDALAGSALAASQDAPLLTTRGECVSTGTLQEIAKLGATSVTVIGGTSAVSANATALQACS
jgi:putative cell wall-binding protein